MNINQIIKTPKVSHFILSALICFASTATADDRQISGRIIDSDGLPVSHASVASFWRANGSSTKPDGSEYDATQHAEFAQYWGNIGLMQPLPGCGVASTNQGTFSIVCHQRTLALLVMDPQRKFGAIATVPETHDPAWLEIRLRPLTTVRGSVHTSLPGKRLKFSHVYVELAHNKERPLGLTNVISCGSLDGSFEFKVPPGEYTLNVYGYTDGLDVVDLHVSPPPQVSINGSTERMDVGILKMQKDPYSEQGLARALRTAKDSGTWRDHTQHFGEIAPEWHITDSQGLDGKSRVTDFRGKWLLINFWGLSCAPCLIDGVPKLTAFYEKHKAHKSRFEIVGVCIDYTGELTSISEICEALEPIERRVWNGKKIPFPVILDSTYVSWQRFGLPGLGTVILVDPNGRMVQGDESTLETILAK